MRLQSQHPHCQGWEGSQDRPAVAGRGTYSHWWRMNGMVAAPSLQNALYVETENRKNRLEEED